MAEEVRFREANRSDLDRLVELLADDPLGARRERFQSPLPGTYTDALAAVDGDPNNALVVAEADGRIVALLQLTFIPGLTYEGGWRAQIEGVRVAREHRSRGVGRDLVLHAVERARERGCCLVQLTTDKARPEALRFYERLGFEVSHQGLKLHLRATDDGPSGDR